MPQQQQPGFSPLARLWPSGAYFPLTIDVLALFYLARAISPPRRGASSTRPSRLYVFTYISNNCTAPLSLASPPAYLHIYAPSGRKEKGEQRVVHAAKGARVCVYARAESFANFPKVEPPFISKCIAGIRSVAFSAFSTVRLGAPFPLSTCSKDFYLPHPRAARASGASSPAYVQHDTRILALHTGTCAVYRLTRTGRLHYEVTTHTLPIDTGD